ncbi:MAG: hypothetical protein JOZ29_09770 [Deltaproteobacteria bacterium]|nr:hypothetical protein [Deltaproteobacteria bacterium]
MTYRAKALIPPNQRLLPVRPGFGREQARAAVRRIHERAQQCKFGRFNWFEWKDFRDEGRQ